MWSDRVFRYTNGGINVKTELMCILTTLVFWSHMYVVRLSVPIYQWSDKCRDSIYACFGNFGVPISHYVVRSSVPIYQWSNKYQDRVYAHFGNFGVPITHYVVRSSVPWYTNGVINVETEFMHILTTLVFRSHIMWSDRVFWYGNGMTNVKTKFKMNVLKTLVSWSHIMWSDWVFRYMPMEWQMSRQSSRRIKKKLWCSDRVSHYIIPMINVKTKFIRVWCSNHTCSGLILASHSCSCILRFNPYIFLTPVNTTITYNEFQNNKNI